MHEPYDPANGAHEPRPPQVLASYLLPVLATITALSFMAAASASIGVWKDVSVMRESMSTLIKNSDLQQKRYEVVKEELQEHEVRLTKGGL
jgi:hypothetical protein